VRVRRPLQSNGPDQAGVCSFQVGAQGGNNFFEVTATIPQLIPCGGVVAIDFDDDSAALPFFIGGRWNNAPNTIKVRRYCINPYAGGTVSAHYAIWLHSGPPN